jgi:hypothetical protein
MEGTTMSSILKALKKVENVPPPKHEESDLRNRISQSAYPLEPKRDKRPLLIAAGIAVVLIAVFFSSRFFPLQKTSPRESGSVTAPAQDTARTPSLPPAPGDPPSATVETAVSVEKVPSPPDQAKREEAPVSPADSVKREPPPPATHSPRKIPQVEKPPVLIKPLKPLPQPVDLDLKLEGIIWSETPGSRYAMIDGKIVKQGGTIQGVKVIRIAEDHVMVQSRDGTQKQRLTVR